MFHNVSKPCAGRSSVRPFNVMAKFSVLHFRVRSLPPIIYRIKNWIYKELGQKGVTYGHSCLPTKAISPFSSSYGSISHYT